MARRVPVVVQVAAVTVAASLVLGAAVTGVLAWLTVSGGEAGPTASDALRQWALWSVVSSPVGFVFGAVAFVIGRSLWRGDGDPTPSG